MRDPERALRVGRDAGAGYWEITDAVAPWARSRWFREVPPVGQTLVYRAVGPVGEPWIIRGYAWGQPAQVRVRNGVLVDDNPIRPISSLAQRLAVRSWRVERVGVWRPAWVDVTVEALFTIALCLKPDRAWYLDCVHVRFHRHAVVIDVIRDGLFDAARAARTLEQPLELDQPHHLAIESEQDRVSLWVDGRRAWESAQVEFRRSAGPNVFWEIHADEGSHRTTAAIQSVAAFAPPASGLSGR